MLLKRVRALATTPSYTITRATWSTRPHLLQRLFRSSAYLLTENSDQNKRYAKSLLLPSTTFPQWTNPLKTEVSLRKKTCDDLYRWQVWLLVLQSYSLQLTDMRTREVVGK